MLQISSLLRMLSSGICSHVGLVRTSISGVEIYMDETELQFERALNENIVRLGEVGMNKA